MRLTLQPRERVNVCCASHSLPLHHLFKLTLNYLKLSMKRLSHTLTNVFYWLIWPITDGRHGDSFYLCYAGGPFWLRSLESGFPGKSGGLHVKQG